MAENIVLFDDGTHRNVLLEDFDPGVLAVQANQHLIVHGGKGMILDPGGHKVFNRVLSETLALLDGGSLEHLFLSHQDPDVLAAANGWLMSTDAQAWCSALWTRFVPHFGLSHLVADRLHAIPDEGIVLDLGGCELLVLPAHFMHSCGNFHVYDPTSKILYTGDLGASIGQPYRIVEDFDAHVPYMEGFHRRYMACNRILNLWVRMVRTLDVEIVAPQHGALIRGRAMVERFFDWLSDLRCGVDWIDELRVPKRT